jgi:hypothetical protein
LTLIYLLYELGYDDRALVFQTLVTWAAFVLSCVATDPSKNINWVFGPGEKPQPVLPPLLYLGLEMAAVLLLVLLPTHLLLQGLF